MNVKFFVLLLSLCLLLCACGGSPAAPDKGKTPTNGETTVPTPTDAADPTTDEIPFTFPSDFPDETLPIHYFDGSEGTHSSSPLDPTQPDVTEPEVTEPTEAPEHPVDNGNGDQLPVDWWD